MGDEPPLHAAHVIAITYEAPCKHCLLIAYPLGDDGEVRQHDYERERGAEYDGHREEQQQRRAVHGVSHDAIESGVDHALPFVPEGPVVGAGPGEIHLLEIFREIPDPAVGKIRCGIG